MSRLGWDHFLLLIPVVLLIAARWVRQRDKDEEGQ